MQNKLINRLRAASPSPVADPAMLAEGLLWLKEQLLADMLGRSLPEATAPASVIARHHGLCDVTVRRVLRAAGVTSCVKPGCKKMRVFDVKQATYALVAAGMLTQPTINERA